MSLTIFAACLAVAAVHAEETGRLKIIADPGLILVDGDTLNHAGEQEIELPAGDHELRFFPYHTVDEWVHRYLVYPFSLGAAGQRTIDLTRREFFTIRSDPQAAELRFRGRYLGLTPGEYMLLVGSGDSVVVQMNGYESQVLQLDKLFPQGTDLFVSLEPKLVEQGMPADDLEAYQYHSPLRKLASLDLMLSLGGGVTLLAVGAPFNQKADSFYDDYLSFLGSRARENAYSKMKRFDRLSKTTFIAGDAALGFFGYMLVRRFIFPAEEHKREEPSRLSLKFQGHSAALSYQF
ncbi:MAG TPA: hypothetical protein VJ417_09460 [Candidatus Glassbacteria bacterium]|nr:hypothetical protein [Candidatus Glassbacteria bacterium]